MSGRIDALLTHHSGDPRRSSTPPKRPRTGVAVLSCMDSRLDLHRILGLAEGDAHIVRNAGGSVTEDVILSLAVSQRLLDTREILVLHHVDCAMRDVHGDELAAAVERDTGQRPPWRFMPCSDPHERLSEAVRLLAASPLLPDTEVVRGVLYDEVADVLTDVCESKCP
jgi:carbonic anhydrase